RGLGGGGPSYGGCSGGNAGFWVGGGGIFGIFLGVGLTSLLGLVPGTFGSAYAPVYTLQLFAQAIVVALIAGMIGGLYPAWRATRLRPVEALRYE
ncbi:MAG: hypothetical protein ACUVWZ_16085, partial [Anaerolineae bacterium]